jgi:hypothetical protein
MHGMVKSSSQPQALVARRSSGWSRTHGGWVLLAVVALAAGLVVGYLLGLATPGAPEVQPLAPDTVPVDGGLAAGAVPPHAPGGNAASPHLDRRAR